MRSTYTHMDILRDFTLPSPLPPSITPIARSHALLELGGWEAVRLEGCKNERKNVLFSSKNDGNGAIRDVETMKNTVKSVSLLVGIPG